VRQAKNHLAHRKPFRLVVEAKKTKNKKADVLPVKPSLVRLIEERIKTNNNGLIGNDASSSVSPGRLAKNKNLEKVHTLRLSNEEFQQ